jgi:hypothetical protein
MRKQINGLGRGRLVPEGHKLGTSCPRPDLRTGLSKGCRLGHAKACTPNRFSLVHRGFPNLRYVPLRFLRREESRRGWSIE